MDREMEMYVLADQELEVQNRFCTGRTALQDRKKVFDAHQKIFGFAGQEHTRQP